MIDAKKARENIGDLRKSIEHRKEDLSKADVDRWIELDEERRKLQGQIDKINADKKPPDVIIPYSLLACLVLNEDESERQNKNAIIEI